MGSPCLKGGGSACSPLLLVSSCWEGGGRVMSQLPLLAGRGLGASLCGANRPQACHAPI